MSSSYPWCEKYTIHKIQTIHTIQYVHTLHTIQYIPTGCAFSRSDPFSASFGSPDRHSPPLRRKPQHVAPLQLRFFLYIVFYRADR
ncbi:hypothetical protein EGO53_28035 (plasmid) [Serratia liquefaciens]|uniref:Uncharacterized protein n=1 Tax=Serratia liquefaciens TaxID=614 RepID=A0A515D5H5_SERLI|nr:hypothetical protein EGO53_28035 [Serratia liquefaciens]